jgi:hypothetical protein
MKLHLLTAAVTLATGLALTAPAHAESNQPRYQPAPQYTPPPQSQPQYQQPRYTPPQPEQRYAPDRDRDGDRGGWERGEDHARREMEHDGFHAWEHREWSELRERQERERSFFTQRWGWNSWKMARFDAHQERERNELRERLERAHDREHERLAEEYGHGRWHRD